MKGKVLISNLLIFLAVLIGDVFYINSSELWIKAITSAGFVLLGLINLIYAFKTRSAEKRFSIIMFIGLVFGMFGDIFLNIEFIVGAIIFAIGHIMYFIAYCQLEKFNYKDLLAGLVIFIPSMLFILLAPIFDFDGSIMKILCVVYALFISCMLGKAIFNFIKERNLLNILLMVGSILFFFSDLMLLLHVFANLSSLANALCLITYYPAQCLLAFSLLWTNSKFLNKSNNRI